MAGEEEIEEVQQVTETESADKESKTEDTSEPEEKDEEALDEAAEEPDDEEQEEPVKPVGRSQARIQKLSSDLKSERAEREKLIADRATAQAQLEHLRQQQHAIQSQTEKRAEEERLALLDPSERALYQANQSLRQMEHRINQMEMQRKDDRDRAEFHAKAAHDETYGKYADQVERMYQEGISRGVSAPREALHSFILGEELKKDMASKISKKKESANKRIDTVTSKPASARGDVAGSKKGKSEEDRLRGVLI